MIWDILIALFGVVLIEAIFALWLLICILAGVYQNLTNTAMTRTLVQNVMSLVTASGAVNGRVNNLSAASTSAGQPPGTPTGGPNGTGFFNTGAQTAGTAHTHPLPNFPTATHTHDFMGHTHILPTV